jgi:hypothetical protein
MDDLSWADIRQSLENAVAELRKVEARGWRTPTLWHRLR